MTEQAKASAQPKRKDVIHAPLGKSCNKIFAPSVGFTDQQTTTALLTMRRT